MLLKPYAHSEGFRVLCAVFFMGSVSMEMPRNSQMAQNISRRIEKAAKR
jgi:hypothetical protein